MIRNYAQILGAFSGRLAGMLSTAVRALYRSARDVPERGGEHTTRPAAARIESRIVGEITAWPRPEDAGRFRFVQGGLDVRVQFVTDTVSLTVVDPRAPRPRPAAPGDSPRRR